jgi:phosphohistidine swiveling domain-containing protein
MNAAILNWDSVLQAGPGETGGKAWRLALMHHLGICVPDGFVLSATQFRERACGEPVSEQLGDAIASELEQRGWSGSALAVRSSATHEDATGTSFAGVYSSVLNVQGRARIASAVQEVLDSYWSEQARAYRQRVRIGGDDGMMAVIVMPLLRATAAGVAFMCDPISGREDRITISATRGLADALVNAQIEGDEYVLARHSPTELALIKRPRSTTPALTDEEALQLGRIVWDAAVALDYTDPCYDIEWVWEGNAFSIVQARPVTTRAHVTYREIAEQPVLWSRANSKEVVPHPFAALDWSIAQHLLQRMLTCTARLAGYEPLPGVRRMMLRRGRLYYETSIMQWEAFDAFDVHPKAYNRLLGGNQPEITVPNSATRERFARALRSLSFLLRSIVPRVRAVTTIRRAHEDAAKRTCVELPSDTCELAVRIRENVDSLLNSDELSLLQAAGSALFVLTKTLGERCGEEAYSLTAALMAGGKPSVTAIQNLRLLQLAQLAGNDALVLKWLRGPDRANGRWLEELPDSEFRNALRVFLQDFGHRGLYESYLRSPRWRESPDYLFDVITGLVDVPSRQVDQRQTALLYAAHQRLREVAPLWMRPTITILVKLAQSEHRMREGARSALVARLGVIRVLVLALARELQKETRLLESEDLFHLTIAELYALGRKEMPLSKAQRRAAWRRKQLTAYAEELEPDVVIERMRTSSRVQDEPKVHRLHESPDSEEWFGTVIAAGNARGIAHVAQHPSDAVNLEPGAILVAPATDPAWTPVFLKAAAVVVEVGGFLSHSAIVAREFGIPALANVHDIVSRVSSGDLLEIDGERGCVRRMKKKI